MSTVYVHPELDQLPRANETLIPVHLYGSRPDQEGAAALGWGIYDELTRVRAPLNPIAFDFLSISLAVIAADTFVSRDDAADGWAREIDLVIALDNPGTWMPVLPKLTRALNFLSGDVWTLRVEGGGDAPPTFNRRVRRNTGCDYDNLSDFHFCPVSYTSIIVSELHKTVDKSQNVFSVRFYFA